MAMGMEASRADEIEGGVLAFGRQLLERLGRPTFTTGHGLASTILPAGSARLLVFGVPLPVFAYLDQGDEELHLLAMEKLRQLEPELPPGTRVALQSFGPCLGDGVLDRCLGWFPAAARAWNGSCRPILLGLDLVTVFPLGPGDAASWPVGPEPLVRFAERLEALVPGIYRHLDCLMAGALARAAPAGQRRRPHT